LPAHQWPSCLVPVSLRAWYEHCADSLSRECANQSFVSLPEVLVATLVNGL
jgi:hypothetical protein